MYEVQKITRHIMIEERPKLPAAGTSFELSKLAPALLTRQFTAFRRKGSSRFVMTNQSVFDLILFILLLAIPLLEWRWTWPRFLARLATGERGVRGRFYRGTVLSEWALVLALLAYWRWSDRPWAWLMLGESTPVRFAWGLLVGLLGALFLYLQRKQILRGDEQAMAEVRRQLDHAIPLLPHGPNENRLFKVVSVTAGVCEEVLFRGFLLWYIAGWTGTMVAVILSSLVFGLGHIYLGTKYVPKTAAAGLVLACLAVASRSLWPAILIHAAMDWNSGELGYRLIGGGRIEAAKGVTARV